MMSTEVFPKQSQFVRVGLVLLGLLEARDAPRVGSARLDVARLLRQVRPRATAATLHSAIVGLIQAGALQKVSRGPVLESSRRPRWKRRSRPQYSRWCARVS